MLGFWLRNPNHRKNLENLKKLQAAGQRVPSLENAPNLIPYAVPYWRAFSALSERRTFIDGKPQMIQFAEMLAYFQLHGIDDEFDIDDHIRYITMLDRQYMEDFFDKQSKNRSRKKKT